MSHFKRVIVIGYGIIAHNVLKVVDINSHDFGYEAEYIEHEVYKFNLAQKYVKGQGMVSHVITDKKMLCDYIMSYVSEKILIISANNNYIFPKCITEHENVVIVNFHNALLPKFPGRNAPSWAIFENECITGITWHYVTSVIDGGDIIVQKKFRISSDIRAYELEGALMRLAAEAFQECFFDILKENIKAKKQQKTKDQKLYLSKDIPGNGKFALTDSVDDIYRLLRALDYGENGVFPAAETILNGERIRIKRYKLVNSIEPGKQYRLYLPIRKGAFLMIKYDILQVDDSEGIIDSSEELYEYVASLKRVNRHLVTNFYISECEIDRYTKEERIYYKFKNNYYLNIWVYEHDFVRLFFYIANESKYEVPDVKKKLICDIFFQSEKNIVGIIDRLKCLDFYEYASYTKWIKKEAVLLYKCNEINIRIESGTAKGFYELLSCCFDIYSDIVPEKKDIIAFLNGKKCYTAFHQNTGEVIGGIVISVHGNVQTEEFVFVRPDMRGQKIAKCLHKRWYDEVNNSGIQYLAWIRDNNYESVRLHSQIGYARHSSKKLTMIKEEQ